MRRQLLELVLGGLLLGVAGCGDPPPEPAQLSAEEEKEFERQQEEARRGEPKVSE